jgi:pyruvate/2-oxoglutarate dehydrogenase complex dihydrolipoamide dehydrogenase (E3) component
VVPAAEAKRVMVIGSGPAGMEAARIARLRGHHVSIWERDSQLGGKLEVAGLAPSKREVLRFREYQSRVLRELGVEIRLGMSVTPEHVKQADPDVVLVATGAEPLIPPIPGIGAAHVFDAQDFLKEEVPVEPGERIAVVGGSATGCEAAELLVELGAQVSILEMRGSIGHGIESITRREMIRALRRKGVEILTRATVVMIDPDQVLYGTPDGETLTTPADKVALAIGWKPRGVSQIGELDGIDVVLLGDADAPGDFVAAINAGADAGLNIA